MCIEECGAIIINGQWRVSRGVCVCLWWVAGSGGMCTAAAALPAEQAKMINSPLGVGCGE